MKKDVQNMTDMDVFLMIIVVQVLLDLMVLVKVLQDLISAMYLKIYLDLIMEDLKVEDHDEVVRLVRVEGGHIGNDPLDFGVPCELPRLLDADTRVVDSGHRPSLTGEPNGVASLTACEVECGACWHPLDDRREEPGRLGPDSSGRIGDPSLVNPAPALRPRPRLGTGLEYLPTADRLS